MKNLILLPCIFLYSCTMKTSEETIEKWKKEIVETERNFAEMVKKEGVKSAFLTFSDEKAVLMRNNSLIKGQKEMCIYFENQSEKNTLIKLVWETNFVEVSNSGDLGYTYGKYNYSYLNSEGNTVKTNGVFHTVWKKQADDTWKFVWD